ncbi:3-deoxy-D-manno-octulosonic acid transferase [Granulicella sp. WH15]|nr:3-deoxy-D-manno-octulosonic acid transferase [Granulicella sp. WH15]
MVVYSLLLALGLVLSAPWWLWRMATSGRYRAGLAGRLGIVPPSLRQAVKGKQVIWFHAVSVGEVVAASRLIAQLQEAFPRWVMVVSTTTMTGQKIARERLGKAPVFYLPLDFAWAVRAYLRVLQPRLMVLMESELWPRLLVECERAAVPVAVVNARISDRSFPRYMRLRRLWRPLLRKVTIFLAQGQETASRLVAIGAPTERVRVAGNLKYHNGTPDMGASSITTMLQGLVSDRKLVVAGSTLPGEEEMLLEAWPGVVAQVPEAVLLIAPRHPERFAEVMRMVDGSGLRSYRATEMQQEKPEEITAGSVVLLDTVGDLATVYGLACVAFLGGSLVAKGGHNPLEAALFGVPVVMGGSYENFRAVVDGMRAAEAIRIVTREQLGDALVELLRDGQEMGARGRTEYRKQSGAVGRTVTVLLDLLEVMD